MPTVVLVAVDSEGHAYVAGATSSPDFPLVAPYQDTMRGLGDGYITKLSANG